MCTAIVREISRFNFLFLFLIPKLNNFRIIIHIHDSYWNKNFGQGFAECNNVCMLALGLGSGEGDQPIGWIADTQPLW